MGSNRLNKTPTRNKAILKIRMASNHLNKTRTLSRATLKIQTRKQDILVKEVVMPRRAVLEQQFEKVAMRGAVARQEIEHLRARPGSAPGGESLVDEGTDPFLTRRPEHAGQDRHEPWMPGADRLSLSGNLQAFAPSIDNGF